MEPPEEESQTTFSGQTIKVPWSAVLKQVPAEFLKRGHQTTPARGVYLLPKETALHQLSQGAVKVPLAEIRRAAPPGLFLESDKGDQQLIVLPLRDILRRLRPDAYERRADQSRVEVPDSVGELFGPRGQSLSAVRILSKEDLRKAKSIAPTPGAPASGKGTHFLPRNPTMPSSTQAQPVAVPGGPIAIPEALKKAMETQAPSLPKGGRTPAGRPQSRAPQAAPARRQAPGLPKISRPSGDTTIRTAAPQARPNLAPPVAAATAPLPGAGSRTIVVPLADISLQWPESIRQEIAYLQLESAQCHLPMAEITTTVKQGRVFFPWKKIRAWLEPTLPADYVSEADDTVLEIPLQAVVPSFLHGRLNAPARPTQTAADDVPDVFRPKAAPIPTARPSAAPPLTADLALQIPPAVTSAPAVAAGGSGVFKIPLENVNATWPEGILKEIQRLNLQHAMLEIPMDVLENDLKSGRIEHCWIQMCSWIPGFPATADTAQYANAQLQLPLQVIAPLFFKHRQAAAAKKSYVPSDIPDLFSSKNQPAAPPAQEETVAAPVQATPPEPVAPEPAPEKMAKKKLPGNIAELFGEPKKRNWTPNEIVHKTAEMEGVAGALIALQDGLLVAACMPPEWKSETVSAFLPQMFGRMKQYARELGAGEMKSLTITVEKGHLQIFNAGLIYFSVLGFPDRALPLPELTIIANELSRHTK